jgi:copper transport protein
MTIRFPLTVRAVFLTCLLALLAGSMLNPGRALAHNEFVESTPSDGDVFTTAPSEWEITFTKDVPLETASGEVVNSDGVRTTLPTPTYGSSTNIVRFALPPDLTGPVTTRWKLASEDGHVVQGRVNFVISPTGVTSDSTTDTTPLLSSDDVVAGSSAGSSITSPAPTPVRWVVRSMGFAAVMLMGGLIFVERMLATPTLIGRRGVLLARTGALSLAAVPFLQNLFLVGDIRSTNIFSALPHFFSTFDLTLGAMLITQTVIGLVVSYIMYNSSSQVISKTNQQFLIALFAMYLIALAFSGHSRTMAWPVVGIPTDIVHTGAAAIWLGGLAALAFLVIPNSSIATSVTTYRQFGYFARYAVIAIVVTGIIQTLRLHGDVVSLFTESHGRILLLKIAVVAGMLKIADINRKRLLRRLDPDAPATEKRISLLWRASVTEIATGGIVLAVTAALVTSSFN